VETLGRDRGHRRVHVQITIHGEDFLIPCGKACELVMAAISLYRPPFPPYPPTAAVVGLLVDLARVVEGMKLVARRRTRQTPDRGLM